MNDVLLMLVSILDSTIRVSTPLILCAMAGSSPNALALWILALKARCWPVRLLQQPLPQ